MANMTNAEWEAENDFRSIVDAEKIRNDPARMSRAKRYAEDRIVDFNEALRQFPAEEKRPFNNAVKNSRMLKNG